MKTTIRIPVRWAPAIAIAVLLTPGMAIVRADDEEVEDLVDARAERAMAVHHFEQWVFGGGLSAAAGRARIESRLSLQLEELESRCRLTGAQKQKLELAARGDIGRFFKRVEASRDKYLAIADDEQRSKDLWPEILPLQQKLRDGLFDEESLFAKTLEKTLDDEQTESYWSLRLERRKFRYKAAIGAALMKLDSAVPLRDEQRNKLSEHLLDETPPPEKFGQLDYRYVMYQLAHLPEEKLAVTLDDVQRQSLSQELRTAKGFERFLVVSKVLADPPVQNTEAHRRSTEANRP